MAAHLRSRRGRPQISVREIATLAERLTSAQRRALHDFLTSMLDGDEII